MASSEHRADVLVQVADMKELIKKNNSRSKNRFDRDGAEIQRLNQLNTELQTKVDELAKELEEVKANIQAAAVDPGLNQELEALRTEKASLEQLLAKEKAAHLISSSTFVSAIAALSCAF